jgi:hypothetical protein
MIGSFSIDDAIAMHLVDCSQCHNAIVNLRPVSIGQKSGHCDTYWELQRMRAEYEGAVNNVVAYTEYGDEARKGGDLLWRLSGIRLIAIVSGIFSIPSWLVRSLSRRIQTAVSRKRLHASSYARSVVTG